MMTTAVRAEKHIDKIAMHMMYEYDKRLKYNGSYMDSDPKMVRAFLEDYYNSEAST